MHRKTLPRFNGMDPRRIGQFAEDPTTPETPDYAAFSDADLAAAYTTAHGRGQELYARPAEELSEAEAKEFTTLADTVAAINTEITSRELKAQHFSEQRDAFGQLPNRSTPPAPSAPVAEPVAAVETPEVPEVPSVTAMAAETPVTPPIVDPVRTGDQFSIVLSSDAAALLNKQSGDSTDVREITRASLGLFKQYGRSRGAAQRTARALGQFRRDRGEALTLRGTEEGDHEVIQHARDQRRLSKGSLMAEWQANAQALGSVESLTAAAGWCAPSENRYELCSLWDIDGIYDAPTTSAPRGGINYTSDFTWADINDAAITSFTFLTEAEVIADTPKDCAELPCPEFTDRRLDVAVTCITGQFLQAHAYPEVVSTWTDGLLTKHAYEINKNIIAQVVAFAGAPIVIPGQNADTSATASILAALEIAAIDMRERSNMSFGQTLEVVLPRWILAQFRADISRRNAWHADPFTLTDQQIISWFTTRNVRPQFVRGWQDAQSGLTDGPGDITAPITPITALPTTVNFLLYPAGAVVIAREDVVTLTNVYDSTNLTTNRFTQLFTEEGYAPIFPCGEVRQYTADACPSGATALQVDTSCPVTP